MSTAVPLERPLPRSGGSPQLEVPLDPLAGEAGPTRGVHQALARWGGQCAVVEGEEQLIDASTALHCVVQAGSGRPTLDGDGGVRGSKEGQQRRQRRRTLHWADHRHHPLGRRLRHRLQRTEGHSQQPMGRRPHPLHRLCVSSAAEDQSGEDGVIPGRGGVDRHIAIGLYKQRMGEVHISFG